VICGERNPIAKALQVLRYVIEEPAKSLGVRSMASALKLSPSSAHRLLNALVREGFLDQNESDGTYDLSLETARLANLILERVPIQRVAVPLLRALVEQCNETVLLGIYERNRKEMMFVATVESKHKLRYVSELRQWMPVYAGASGLGIMAFLDASERDTIIARTGLAPITDRTITEPFRLEHELANIRQRGYACTTGQRTPGATAIAAPIFGADGAVMGDVVATLPELRFDRSSEGYFANLVMDCARSITEQTGGKTYQPAPLRPFIAAPDPSDAKDAALNASKGPTR
jgi:DNA-binding IclR family transcriptional regulator